jgi:cytosine/adenosine deaminase-related metal-dependent hydrolase
MIYTANLLYPGDGPPVRDGWIRIEGGWVTATGCAADFPGDAPADTIRRVDGALMPGLVNLHCHLELTGLHEKLTEGNPFPAWVEELRGHTAAFDAAAYREAAHEGIRRLVAGGCTTVLDVGNTGEALHALAESPVRSFACVETLGLDPRVAAERFASAQALAAATPATARFHPGLAPHAAYSMSPGLLRRVIDEQRARGLPVTIHAAESREEAELFAHGTGPLADYCRRIHPDAPRHFGTTPVRWLESEGLLPDGLILVHGNTLDDGDMEILARRRATVVHCPSSHKFFGHPRFPYERLREYGVNVGLGTDSLASGDSLSMVEQMRLFSRAYPDVPAEEVVALATVNGARALGLKDAGLLKAGSRAEFTALSLPEHDGFAGDVLSVTAPGT